MTTTTYITQAVGLTRQLQELDTQLGQRPLSEARRTSLNDRHRDLTAQRHELIRLALGQPGVDTELIRWALDLHADTDVAAELRAQLSQLAEAYQAGPWPHPDDLDLAKAANRLQNDLAPLVGRWAATLAGQNTDARQLHLAKLTVAEQLLPAVAAAIAAQAATAAAAAGADYVAIGQAAGMKRQGARKRWPGLVPQTRGVPAAERKERPQW